MLRIDPHSFLLASGTLYLAMPVAVWILLRNQHPRLNLDLWCISGLLVALMIVLFGLRGQAGDWLTVHLANAAGYLAMTIKTGVLRAEGRERPHWPWLMALAVLATAVTAWAHWVDTALRIGVVSLLHSGGMLLAALAALQLARSRQSRSAQLMAVLFTLYAAALTVRALPFFGAIGSPATAFAPDLLFLSILILALVAGVGANIGFMGLAIDAAQATSRDQQATMDSLRDNQQALDVAARTREAVDAERARTTRLLAHEVRQPLHNAAVALQTGIAKLARSGDVSEAARAIEQAQAVIRRVSATLDNTVAATTMLAAQGRISTADTDLQMVIDLCLGDLPPEARARVQIDYRADARSAQLEISLIRLALRNLLTNATLYAPPDTAVILSVLDSDEPLALVLEVADQGPGIDDELHERIFDEGTRGKTSTVPGYGLGLHVVKRVAKLHGGSIAWRPNQPCGSIFTLTLPQGDPG